MSDFLVEMRNNEDFKLTFQIKDAAGSPVDITGATFKMHGKETREDTTTLFEWDTTTEITVTDGPNGEVEIDVAVGTVSAFDFERCIADLQMVLSGATTVEAELEILLIKGISA